MGWLFAVSLGLQARSGRAVWSALAPLALGHALAVAAALAAAAVLGMVLPRRLMRWICRGRAAGFRRAASATAHASALGGRAGMCVGPRQLTTWSFLVSSAHGAGLMVLPFVLGRADNERRRRAHSAVGGHAEHLAGVVVSGGQTTALFATLLHTAGYFAVTGAIAWVVYERLGLALPAQCVDQHERHLGRRTDRDRRGDIVSMRMMLMTRSTYILFLVGAIVTLHAPAARGQGAAGGAEGDGTWGFVNARYDTRSSASIYTGYGWRGVFRHGRRAEQSALRERRAAGRRGRRLQDWRERANTGSRWRRLRQAMFHPRSSTGCRAVRHGRRHDSRDR